MSFEGLEWAFGLGLGGGNWGGGGMSLDGAMECWFERLGLLVSIAL